MRSLVALTLLVLAAWVAAEDVQAKGLVKERVTAKAILANARHADEASAKVQKFSGDTLAFVTPWNSEGYENAKRFAAKFTYVSPVWYRLERRAPAEPLVLVGRHDVDTGWIAAVRAAALARPPLIVPRVYVEPSEQVTDVEWVAVVADVLAECAAHRFDGIVLDVGFAAVRAFQEGRLGFLHHIAAELHARRLRFVLSVPPYAHMFSAANFDALAADIDAFALMTYDYHAPSGGAAPVSPHWWATQSVLSLLSPELRASPVRAKLLLGANLYGYEYAPGAHGPRAITGNDLLRLLDAHKATARFEWDQDAHEHRLTYRLPDASVGTVYFPSLLSLSDRVQLAESLGVGLSLWEIGQPLPYFFDLL